MSNRQVPGKPFCCSPQYALHLAIRISFSFIRQRGRTTYMLRFSMMVWPWLGNVTIELDCWIRFDTVRTIRGSLFTPFEGVHPWLLCMCSYHFSLAEY
jgi:hypothetical protein